MGFNHDAHTPLRTEERDAVWEGSTRRAHTADNNQTSSWRAYATNENLPPKTETLSWPWRSEGALMAVETEKRPLMGDKFLEAVPPPPEAGRRQLGQLPHQRCGTINNSTNNRSNNKTCSKSIRKHRADASVLSSHMEALGARLARLVRLHQSSNAARAQPLHPPALTSPSPPASSPLPALVTRSLSDTSLVRMEAEPLQDATREDARQPDKSGSLTERGPGGDACDLGQMEPPSTASISSISPDVPRLKLPTPPLTMSQEALGSGTFGARTHRLVKQELASQRPDTHRGRLEGSGSVQSGARVATADASHRGKTYTARTLTRAAQAHTSMADHGLSWVRKLVMFTESNPIHIPDKHVLAAEFEEGRWEQVVFPAAWPIRRQDTQLLHQWMLAMLDEVSMEHPPSDNTLSETVHVMALSDSALWIYRVAFEELHRQVGLHCAERAVLLKKLWEQFFSLVELRSRLRYEQTVTELQDKLLDSSQRRSETEVEHAKALGRKQEEIEQLRLDLKRELARSRSMASQAVQEQHVAVAAVENTKELNDQLLVEVKLRMRHEKSLDAARDEVVKLRHRLEACEGECGTLRRARAALQDSNENLQHGLQLEIDRNKDLQKQMEDHVAKHKDADEQLAQRDKSIGQLKEKIASMEEALSLVTSSFNDVSTAYKDTKEQLDDATKALNTSAFEKQEVEKQLAEKSQARVSIELLHTRAKKEVANLKRKLEDSRLAEAARLAEHSTTLARLELSERTLMQERDQLLANYKALEMTIIRHKSSEQQAKDEADVYRAELQGLAEFLDNPRMMLENPERRRELSKAEQAEWKGQGCVSKGQLTIRAACKQLALLTATLEASLRARDVSLRQCASEEQERKNIGKKLYEEMLAGEKLKKYAQQQMEIAHKHDEARAAMEDQVKEHLDQIVGLKEEIQQRDFRINELENNSRVARTVGERYERVKTQLDQAVKRMEQMEIEATTLADSLHNMTALRDRAVQQGEEQGTSVDYLHKQVNDYKTKLDECQTKNANLNHQNNLKAMEIMELKTQSDQFKSQVEQQDLQFRSENSRLKKAIANQKLAIASLNHSIAVSKFFLQGLAVAPRTHQPAQRMRSPGMHGMDSKSLLIQATEMDVVEDDRRAPLPETSVTSTERMASSPSGVEGSAGDGLRNVWAADGEGGKRVSAVDTFVQQQAQVEAEHNRKHLMQLQQEVDEAKKIAQEATKLLEGLAEADSMRAELAATEPAHIPEPKSWRSSLVTAQLGLLTDAVQRLRAALREKNESEEVILSWAKENLEDIAMQIVQEFDQERQVLRSELRRVREMQLEVELMRRDTADAWQHVNRALNRLRRIDQARANNKSASTLVQDDVSQTYLQDLIASIPKVAAPKWLVDANPKDKCMRIIVLVYTKRLEHSFASYTDAQRVRGDTVVDSLREAFASIYPNAAADKVQEKMREFVHVVRQYQDEDAKCGTFCRFLGVDVATALSQPHFVFFAELLDCVRRLAGTTWRLIVSDWEKGSTVLPLTLVMDAVGNVYNTNTPQAEPIARDYLMKVLKNDPKHGSCVDLDTFMTLMLREYPSAPVHAMFQPRTMSSSHVVA